MGFDFNKAKPVQVSSEAKPAKLQMNFAPLPMTKPTPIAKENQMTNQMTNQVATPVISGIDLLDNIPTPMTYKEQLAELPSLEDLANEFNNPEQPEQFTNAAVEAVHKACLQLESAIDNADSVREQLTFIMTELRKYPEVAAQIWDSDIAIMVKSLRHSYNVVAFAKQATKKKKEAKATKVNEMLAAADASGLFDGLDL